MSILCTQTADQGSNSVAFLVDIWKCRVNKLLNMLQI